LRRPGKVLTITESGKDPIKFIDVVVGDVWICSGQSNMAFSLYGTGAQDDIIKADFPDMRHFPVFPNTIASSPKQDFCNGAWRKCSKQTAGGWTAVGFYFGRRLHSELGVPVGLINTSWGGTLIEPWTSLEAFDTIPELAEYIAAFRKEAQIYRQALPEKTKNGSGPMRSLRATMSWFQVRMCLSLLPSVTRIPLIRQTRICITTPACRLRRSGRMTGD